MPKKVDRIQFAKNLRVSISGRGYVTAKVGGTKVSVECCMDYKLKSELEDILCGAGGNSQRVRNANKRWEEEMKRLEVEAVAEAKREFKAAGY